MPEHQHHGGTGTPPTSFRTATFWIAAIAFLSIAAFLLLSEHRARALGWLPFALLLACPLLHHLMHRGHHGHGRHVKEEDRATQSGGARSRSF
jgi:hypothetical protein